MRFGIYDLCHSRLRYQFNNFFQYLSSLVVRHHGQDISRSVKDSGLSKFRKRQTIVQLLKIPKARLATSRKWKRTWQPVLPPLSDSEMPQSPFRPALV